MTQYTHTATREAHTTDVSNPVVLGPVLAAAAVAAEAEAEAIQC